MNHLRILTFLFCSINYTLNAQIIRVQPYLQDVKPNSIYILWETSIDAESKVEWGISEALGNLTSGTSNISVGESRIQEIKLEGLESFTNYYYRAISGNDTTAVFMFKTPPLASADEPFRIIAMSDMQQDAAFPDKFEEVINDGIIAYLDDEFGGDLSHNLALVLIPGDLVDNGNNYNSWKTTFFDPAQNLLSRVPVYPVLGNHELNTTYFFQYFRLPENGTVGFEEHWWHKDYGNVRIIGLDSNSPFTNPEQLDWLDTLLAVTCEADSIDFVFAQLHHPHKSELWTPGESDYTGEVIERLEQFTSQCGKPSIHLFGHTHGYSRGQSRDHKHLWINAATAGGAIDLWGDWPQFDYDEFSVSQDEYGFVSVEITSDDDPKVIVKRITRGDGQTIIDNDITDSCTVRLFPTIVNIPTPFSPIDTEIAPECVLLEAGAFVSPNTSAIHGQSHWQVSLNQNDFTNPVTESWKNFENWYFEENTQANDDLKDERIQGLNEFTNYWWRVRYRDRELNWSDWSAAVGFSTGASNLPPNLLVNPGSENMIDQWTVIEGVVESLTNGECNGVSAYSGARYFAVGGLCEHSAVARCFQDVNVSSYAASIDGGDFPVHFGGALSDFSGDDIPEMKLIFLDENLMELGTSNTLVNASPNWIVLNSTMEIPSLTRIIRVELKGTRIVGTDNDSYFDDLFLRVGAYSNNCDIILESNKTIPLIPQLKVSPNPVNSVATISLDYDLNSTINLVMIDIRGSKINCPLNYKQGQILCDMSQFNAGQYVFWVRSNGRVLGTGKIIVQ